MKGKFIVIEGIDGCGKTTQINYLAKWLTSSGHISKGNKLIITREPGGTELGKRLRKLLLDNSFKSNPEPITELLLYAADRAQHVTKLIIPSINRGDWVISDRFSGSTIAYQGYGRKLNMDIIKKLEEIATLGIKPDITLLLSMPVQQSIERRVNIKDDRIEKEGLKFLEDVSIGFQLLAKERNWINISASEKPEIVSTNIEYRISKILTNISK